MNDCGRIAPNVALGKLIESLYEAQNGPNAMRATMRNTQSIQAHEEEIKEVDEEGDGEVLKVPNELAIKLSVLGRAFSGKKTIAAQLQEKFGGKDNIKIFNMDEIIKEALDYITPKKVDEAAAAEAAKKAKKGKQEEVTNVDIFEGKHPEDFKNLATEMKQKFFTDYEGELPQKSDLANLVFDDALLVNLFVERLKLEYENTEMTVSEDKLEEGIRREKELVEQLEALEDTSAPVDPKAKGKGAAKGGGKDQSETLKEELDSIRNVEAKGWILLDFPRNLTQMKMLETCLSGYVSKTDMPKNDLQQKFEAWSKLATPSEIVDEAVTGEVEAETSGLDGVVILNTPEPECARRASNRKIDPQTQIVYHMETNPPDDAKTLERLQDYTDEAGNPERMQKISSGFNQSINAIKQWLTRFGLSGQDKNCQVQLDMEINLEAPDLNRTVTAHESVDGKSVSAVEETKSVTGASEKPAKDPWQSKDAVLKSVFARVEQVRAFRQREFNKRRDSIRVAMEEREKREAEEEAERLRKEEEEKAAATSR